MNQKCNNCGSEWNSHIESEKCPFCGDELKIESNEQNFKDLGDVLKHIVDKYGIELYKKPMLLISYITDLAPSFSQEGRLLRMLIPTGIFESVFQNQFLIKNNRELFIEKCVKTLVSDFYINDKAANDLVSWLVYGIGWDICYNKDSANKKEIHNTSNNDFDNKKNAELLYDDAMKYLDESSSIYNESKGINLLEEAAQKGYVNAQVELGVAYLNGEYHIDKNDERAYYWLSKSLENYDNVYVKFLLTFILFSDGIYGNYTLGRQYLNEAVEANIADAQYNAATYILTGLYGFEENDSRALELARKAAAQGHKEAEKFVGEIYLYIYKDIDKAVEWLEKSGEKENLSAYVVLIELYWNIIRDDNKAKYYLDKVSALVHNNKKLLLQLSGEELEKLNGFMKEINK